MSDQPDYSEFTTDELRAQEKRMKRGETYSAAIIGFLIGVMVYGVSKNGFGFIYIAFPIILILGVMKNGQSKREHRKAIQEEISNRT